MAENNIEIKLLEVENEFLRTNMNEQQQNFDLITRREIELKKIIDALQKQRNQCKEDYEFLSTAMKDEIHKLKNEIKQYKTQIEDYNQQLKNKQTELDNIKEKLISKQEQLDNIKDKLISKQEELHSIQEEVIFQQKELAKCNAALSEKSSEVRDLRNKLDKNEEKYKKLLLHNQMALVRSGLSKFEERKITDFNPSKRGEQYNDFLKSINNINLPVNIATCVKNLFLKLNTSIHNCHSVEDTVIVEEGENAFSKNEVKLLTTLWQLSPLNYLYSFIKPLLNSSASLL